MTDAASVTQIRKDSQPSKHQLVCTIQFILSSTAANLLTALVKQLQQLSEAGNIQPSHPCSGKALRQRSSSKQNPQTNPHLLALTKHTRLQGGLLGQLASRCTANVPQQQPDRVCSHDQSSCGCSNQQLAPSCQDRGAVGYSPSAGTHDNAGHWRCCFWVIFYHFKCLPAQSCRYLPSFSLP